MGVQGWVGVAGGQGWVGGRGWLGFREWGSRGWVGVVGIQGVGRVPGGGWVGVFGGLGHGCLRRWVEGEWGQGDGVLSSYQIAVLIDLFISFGRYNSHLLIFVLFKYFNYATPLRVKRGQN